MTVGLTENRESGDNRDRIGEVRLIGELGWGSGGLKGGVGGMWSRHTISLVCFERKRTTVGAPGAEIEREVGGRIQVQEPEDWKRGVMARSE